MSEPTQDQIGHWLGISQPQVSKYGRAGMPLHDLEAAAQWYDANVHPRARNIEDGREPVRPLHQRDGRYRQHPDVLPAPPPGFPPDATPEQVFGDMAAMPGDAALQLALTLSRLALPLLKAGRFAEVEDSLRLALRAVPKKRRDDLKIDLDDESPDAIPGSVWEELIRPLLDRLAKRDDATVQRDRESIATQSAAQTERVSRFMYQLAAGEIAFASPAPAVAAPAPAKKKARRR
jgi:hypothetical protein